MPQPSLSVSKCSWIRLRAVEQKTLKWCSADKLCTQGHSPLKWPSWESLVFTHMIMQVLLIVTTSKEPILSGNGQGAFTSKLNVSSLSLTTLPSSSFSCHLPAGRCHEQNPQRCNSVPTPLLFKIETISLNSRVRNIEHSQFLESRKALSGNVPHQRLIRRNGCWDPQVY